MTGTTENAKKTSNSRNNFSNPSTGTHNNTTTDYPRIQTVSEIVDRKDFRPRVEKVNETGRELRIGTTQDSESDSSSGNNTRRRMQSQSSGTPGQGRVRKIGRAAVFNEQFWGQLEILKEEEEAEPRRSYSNSTDGIDISSRVSSALIFYGSADIYLNISYRTETDKTY